jgi:hypothetical protein
VWLRLSLIAFNLGSVVAAVLPTPLDGSCRFRRRNF